MYNDKKNNTNGDKDVYMIIYIDKLNILFMYTDVESITNGDKSYERPFNSFKNILLFLLMFF